MLDVAPDARSRRLMLPVLGSSGLVIACRSIAGARSLSQPIRKYKGSRGGFP